VSRPCVYEAPDRSELTTGHLGAFSAVPLPVVAICRISIWPILLRSSEQ